MPSASSATSIGIDFGTSNTVVAFASTGGQVETFRFEQGGISHSGYASTLCFSPGGASGPQVEGGPWAIERFLERATPLRFIQSFKTFAASRTFQQTTIFRQRFLFEDLLAAFLQTLAHHVGPAFDLTSAHVTVGRPVAFAGSAPDDTLAMERYRQAFGQLGVEHARYVYEPLGAAFSFARRVDRDATVLVADFGGGTSDFSLMRFSQQDGRLRAEPLGHAGIGIAGDTFDARIVDHVVAPRLGKGGSYRSFEKVLPLPKHFYATLSRWNELAFMKGSRELRDLQDLTRFALDPEPIHDFISLVENDLGYPLYRAVSTAKVALSGQEAVDFEFTGEGLSICARIERTAFERWINDDLALIGATVDKVLETSGVTASQVEKVFLTGGTSFVPAVQALFAGRFGDEKVTAADQFESIAQGLALIGLSENPDQWAFAA